MTIGIIGDHFGIEGAQLSNSRYASLVSAIASAGVSLGMKVNIERIDHINKSLSEHFLSEFDGVVIPGTHDKEGIEKKLETIKFCRLNRIPVLGICSGVQLMAIEYARNVGKIKDAQSEEFDKKTKSPIVLKMKNMRVGIKDVEIFTNTLAYNLYGKKNSIETHWHNYELNKKMINKLKGLKISGKGNDGVIEIIELRNHPFFLGVQFHPEYQSPPNNPHPIIIGFLKSVAERR